MILSRRGILQGLGAAVAAPAVVRSGVLMPVRRIVPVSSGLVAEGPIRIVRGTITAEQLVAGSIMASSITAGDMFFATGDQTLHVWDGHALRPLAGLKNIG